MTYTLKLGNDSTICSSDKELLYKVVHELIIQGVNLTDLENTGCVFQQITGNDKDDVLENTIQNTIEQRKKQKYPHKWTYGRPQAKPLREVLISLQPNRYMLLLQSCPLRLRNLKTIAEAKKVNWVLDEDVQKAPIAGQGNGIENPKEKSSVTRPTESTLCPNVILFGPPGTGKTYAAISVAAQILDPDADENGTWNYFVDTASEDEKEARNSSRESFATNRGTRIHFITFHQSYSYEDFIGGLRPVTDGGANLRFKWEPGIFLRACAAAFKQAQKTKAPEEKSLADDVDKFLNFCSTANLDSYKEQEGKPYPSVVLVIDEINRANMSRVFGELITLLEDDKRLGGQEQLIVSLPNHPKGLMFGVPKNLIIIGTMNTADKSLALLDLALRRRFEFVRLDPTESVLSDGIPNVGNLQNILVNLNKKIAIRKKSTDFAIGHAYLMNVKDKASFEAVLDRKIVPLLEEYFGGNQETVLDVLKAAGVQILEQTIPNNDGKAYRFIERPVRLENKDKPQIAS
ncbi:MAG: AAA family ATPase [Verrucomicrobiota bacterium]